MNFQNAKIRLFSVVLIVVVVIMNKECFCE